MIAQFTEALRRSKSAVALRELFQGRQGARLSTYIAKHDTLYGSDQSELESGEAMPYIHEVIIGNSTEMLQLLLKHVSYSNLDSITNSEGLTPLAQCALLGRSEAMQCLFTHARDKFDVNYRMDDGCTALHVAVLYEFPGTENNYENPCLHLLLKNGANINCGNTCKEGSALHLAIKNEYMANASYLLQQRLAKFDFGERDNYQNTILHEIVYLRKRELWQLAYQRLLELPQQERVAIINERNFQGNTILHDAATVYKADPFFLDTLRASKDTLYLDTNALTDTGESVEDIIKRYQGSVVFEHSQSEPKPQQQAIAEDSLTHRVAALQQQSLIQRGQLQYSAVSQEEDYSDSKSKKNIKKIQRKQRYFSSRLLPIYAMMLSFIFMIFFLRYSLIIRI